MTVRDTTRRTLTLAWLALAVAACRGGAATAGPSDGSSPDSAPDATPVDAAPADPVPVDAAIDARAMLPDAPLVPPRVPVPRLIAPLSLTTVTQQRPTLRWELPAQVTAPIVDLCRDRSCTAPLAIVTQLAADGSSAAIQANLPPGWIYWRVRALAGGQPVTTATWQFWVGARSASNPVDTSNGTILDVNGDGFADFLVAAPAAASETGAVYLYLGSPGAGAASWNGTAPSARIQLFGSGGQLPSFGASVASAGDVNGDGFADFLINAGNGGLQLFLGSATPSVQDWIGPTATLRIDLENPAPRFGGFRTAAGAGDVNGDGFADFVVGTGQLAYVFFGSAQPSAAAWRAPSLGKRIDIVDPQLLGIGPASFGAAVSGAGDVNGDGFSDFIVGNLGAAAYLYLGTPAAKVASWSGPSPALRIKLTDGNAVDGEFGNAVASAGDVNGDGYADFLIGARTDDAGTVNSVTGAAHLYFGSAAPSAAGWTGAAPSLRVDLVSPDGAMGSFGWALASAGDVNGDGFSDFIVTSATVGPTRGAAHLYLGAASVNPTRWNGTPHGSRTDLANPDGANARFGGSAASVGDVNGDGFPDFLIGTYSDGFLSSATGGAAHIYLGLSLVGHEVYNGASASQRVDLANPAGLGSRFGNAVARSTQNCCGSRRG
jgi:hypothetical protein